jgi:hypothetical protein
MNTQATATQTPVEFVNRNSRKGPTCACGRVQGVCDNSCNTFAATDAPDPYAKRREYHAAALWAMDADGAAAEGETFSEWKSRKGGR